MNIEGPQWQFIAAPAKARWSETYAKMADAAMPGAPPARLVAK
jgi:hypothetical protein